MSWALRCKDKAIPLPSGRHLIGRASDCTVRIEDGLVSRQHAALIVDDEGVILQDLGSRNGVYLKYRRLAAQEEVRLFHGDAFLVGQTNLVLVKQKERKRSGQQTMIDPDRAGTPPEVSLPAATGLGMPYKKFLAEADRAFAQGDYDRFAGATHLLLATLSAALLEGMAADEPAFQAATKHALALAEMRGIEWVDQLLALYEAGGLVPSIETITTLRQLFDEHRWRSERLAGYIERVRPVLEDAGPRGRALLMQLETLKRHQSGG